MGEAKRRKTAGTYPAQTKRTDGVPDDDEARRQFMNRPDVRAFAESPEGARLLWPITAKFLGDIGVVPQVDAEAGTVVIDMADICEKLGLDAADEIEKLGDSVITVPADRLKPLQ